MRILISIIFIISTACGRNNSYTKKRGIIIDSIRSNYIQDSSIGKDSFLLTGSDHLFPLPEQYNPINFIEAASKKVKTKKGNSFFVFPMVDNFPIHWVKKEHIDSLIMIINSKDTCNCFLNPISSYIPSDNAEKGGYAAVFIQSYKEMKPIRFGMYACPKVDEKLNKELIIWWKNENDK